MVVEYQALRPDRSGGVAEQSEALFPGHEDLRRLSNGVTEREVLDGMKHGPIALIEEAVPTIVLAPRDDHHEKVISNLQEVKARRGHVLAVHTEGDEETAELSDFAIPIPDAPAHVLPLITAVPMQLIAYYMADFKGTDVDQPRNLAKSVTVE